MLWLPVMAAASSLWENAMEAQPDPGVRELSKRSYFVVESPDPQTMASANGWSIEEPFPIRDHWLLSAPKSLKRSLAEHQAGAMQHNAKSFYASEKSRLQKRRPLPKHASLEAIQQEFGIHDPLFKEQWFIYNPVEQGNDMNVVPVWRKNITGKGVTVAIVDDGLDYDHPDFADSFSKEGSWDFNSHQQLPKPILSDDNHGTRCAGEIAAGSNNVCGVGVAPGAKVAGIRILSGDLTTSDEARSLIHRYNVNDIYSCSWGPSDDGATIDGPPKLVKRAEVDGIENGRHGKGSIYVVASGNGDLFGDNCNYDGYTNSIYSITVGAIDRQNRHPYYAESCSANMVVTYSSNYVEKITTTDRLDPAHPEIPKCTNRHSGTSAAAPIAAGIFALVLEQRPELTWRDLQYLVRDTAKTFDIVPTAENLAGYTWMKTADGRLYHNSYGYGLLDADAIVERAKTWELVKPQTWLFMPVLEHPHPITPTSRMSLEVPQKDWDESNLEYIEHVRVRVSYQHELRGSLTFKLESPAGIVSELAAPRKNDLSNEAVRDWEFLSVVHWNETGAGIWRLHVEGPEEGHGVLQSWQLKFYGAARDPKLVKKYSEIWDEMEGHTSLVTDKANEDDEENEKHESVSSEFATTTEAGTQGSTATETSTMTDSTSARATATATEKPDAPEQTHGPEDHLKDKSSHSFLYWLVVSATGVTAFAFVSLTVLYFAIWRRGGTATSYVSLGENVELEDFSDEFEIDDDSPAEEVPEGGYGDDEEDTDETQTHPQNSNEHKSNET